MSTITLHQVPGFVDFPEARLAAEMPATGLALQRANGNAKFGLVRPEVFVGFYRDGDTVDLPTSTVDGYVYQRQELNYLWTYAHTAIDGKIAGKGTIWYFGCKVDQADGKVISNIKYRESESVSSAQMTTDGILRVTTIGIRRRDGLTMSATPTFTDHPDSDYALDKPLRTTPLTDLMKASKFAAINTEAIYMGEFVHGDQIPQPVSPVDGYVYPYANVKFPYAWRWTTQPAAFEDPLNYNFAVFQVGLNQLNEIKCAIDATGHVTLNVNHTQDGDQLTNNGRITVVAFCQRGMPALSTPANQFTDVADDYFASGAVLRQDALEDVNQNVHYAACRPEIFESTETNGTTVPLPTSLIDGYTYSRDELMYLAEWKDLAPTSNIRVVSSDLMIDPLSGTVNLTITHMRPGGGIFPSNDGSVKVWTLAMRGHVAEADHDSWLVTVGTEADQQGISNPGFDQWTTPSQMLADDWQVTQLLGTCTGERVDGLTESKSAQRVTVPAFNGICLASSKASVKPKDLRYLSLNTQGSAAAGTLIIRIAFYNKDRRSVLYCNLVANTPGFTGSLQHFDLWFQVPTRGDAYMQCSTGVQYISDSIGTPETLDFLPAYVAVELFCWSPAVDMTADFDDVVYGLQPNPAAGQVAQRGSGALAFFPAVHVTYTDTTADIDLTFAISRIDGSITTATNAGHFAITGLTPGTDYALELYLDETTGEFAAMNGGHGSNGWCYLPSELTRDLAVAWYDQSHLPLSSSPIHFTTSAPGGGGGGGYGGGDGGCPMVDLLVRDEIKGVIRAGQVVPMVDRLWGPEGFNLAIANDVIPHEDWALVDFSNGAKDIQVTSGSLLRSALDGSEVRACELTLNSWIPCPTGSTSPIGIERKFEKSFKARITLEKPPNTYYVSADGVHWVELHNMMIETGTL